jgi:hypothetical protein
MNNPLPRLLLLSDAPLATNGRGNSEALVRLFERYSPGSIAAVQTQGPLPPPDRRLPNVNYQLWPVLWDRLLRTRLSRPANILKVFHHRWFWKNNLRAALAVKPEAVVTLVVGNSWVVAGRIASALNLPLHLIIHDVPRHFHLDHPITGRWLEQEFVTVCQQAASRWSICSALDQHITRMTGVPGSVLPPLRAPGETLPSAPAPQSDAPDAVYFGGLTSVSITEMMNDLATVLTRVGGRLHAYGGISPDVAASRAWRNRAFIHHGAFDDRAAFLAHCRRSFRFMYLPFSFIDESTRLSFPSKLVDYALTGLPILVHGPTGSPVGVWCHENPGAALFVGETGSHALAAAVARLICSEELRLRLAQGALEAGIRDFAFEPNWNRFLGALCRGSSSLGTSVA